MARPRRASVASIEGDAAVGAEQELGSMYDYLAKIILLGPSGSGKSCLLHRFVKNEWRVLTSHTIGVEFASKIVKVGSGPRRKRIKLQLWDTAGTERFRSVSRSYYRGAAGALLVYDISSRSSFTSLSAFLEDARALASPQLATMLVGNKTDLGEDQDQQQQQRNPSTLRSRRSQQSDLTASFAPSYASQSDNPWASSDPSSYQGDMSSAAPSFKSTSSHIPPSPALSAFTISSRRGDHRPSPLIVPYRCVTSEEATAWASSHNIPVTLEASAFTGDNVDQLFERLAAMILTKIELGDIDPDDPSSGIQYGDWGAGMLGFSEAEEGSGGVRRRRNGYLKGGGQGLREWEEVFRIDRRRGRSGCC